MNKKNIIRLTESELKRIITESVKNILKESVAPWEQDSAYYNGGPTNDWYTEPGEERWNQLLKMRNEGLLTDDELDAIRDRFGY